MLINTDYLVHSLRTDAEIDGTNYRRGNKIESLGEVIKLQMAMEGGGRHFFVRRSSGFTRSSFC